MQMLRELGNMAEWTRATSRDIRMAYAMASVFFLGSLQQGLEFDDPTGVREQEERSKHIPSIRSHHSNVTRPKAFWNEWEGRLKTIRTPSGRNTWSGEIWQEDEKCVIRPILARFYKQGIIETAYRSGTTGYAMAGQETDKQQDLYFDFRSILGKTPRWAPGMQNPLELSHMYVEASAFAATRPNARFSVLRIWSTPHFYPLIIGPDNRDSTSFVDPCGRTMECKFIPKDMLWSEWSVQFNVAKRFKPYRTYFKGGTAMSEGGFPGRSRRGDVDHIHVRRDKVLVMGENEEECLKYTTAAIYCLQTKPWTFEVDMHKSFGNISLDFSKGLDDYWTT